MRLPPEEFDELALFTGIFIASFLVGIAVGMLVAWRVWS